MIRQAEPLPLADARENLDRAIARLLVAATLTSVGILAIGVILLIARGTSPLDLSFERLDVARIPADLAGLRAEGFLWLGLMVIVATPAARVGVSLVGYARGGERSMALISAAILTIIGASILLSSSGG